MIGLYILFFALITIGLVIIVEYWDEIIVFILKATDKKQSKKNENNMLTADEARIIVEQINKSSYEENKCAVYRMIIKAIKESAINGKTFVDFDLNIYKMFKDISDEEYNKIIDELVNMLIKSGYQVKVDSNYNIEIKF